MQRTFRLFLCFAIVGAGTAACLASLSVTHETIPQEEVYEFSKVGENGITAPRPTFHPDPTYTDRARRKKINGSVLLSLVVTAEGDVRDARITTGLDKDLDKQALKTVSTWRFQPATKDGKPVAVRIAVEVSFRIR